MKLKDRLAIPLAVFAGAVAGFEAARVTSWASSREARAQGSGSEPPAPAQAAPAAIDGLLPDQAHAMADVGYHFANLWFAAQAKNWPLAGFYLDETRSHLKWGVRIKPLRKDLAGRDVNLPAILEGVENSFFTEVRKAIDAKDAEKFTAAYRASLEGCYGCHKASDKPYLRPQVPRAPPAAVINFDPEASWPR